MSKLKKRDDKHLRKIKDNHALTPAQVPKQETLTKKNLFAPKSKELLFDSEDGSHSFRSVSFNKEIRYRAKDLARNVQNPRIRTKTRSKQKNLRKDTRSDQIKRQKFGE